MKLSEYVKNYRTSHGLSLRAFAEKCGCSHQYLDKLEKDNIESPSFGQLLKIAKAMGMTLHELIGTVDDMEIKLVYDDIVSDLEITTTPNEMTSTYNRLNEYNKRIIRTMAESLVKTQDSREDMP